MKLLQTEFLRQLVGVVLATLFVVMSCAFVSIPVSLGENQALTQQGTVRHLS